MNKEDIKVRFTEEQAKDILNEIKNKICGVDLDELCGSETNIEEDKKASSIYKKLIQGIRCGLVEWDETKNCIVQHLIRPLKSGTIERTDLFYRTRLKFGNTRDYQSENNGKILIKTVSQVTGEPYQIIEELSGQDLTIAIGCTGFFDK